MFKAPETSNNKKKKASETEVLSWRQKKELADIEEHVLEKQIEELISWTCMVESMSKKQLKEYARNRPEDLRSDRLVKDAPENKVRKNEKAKASTSSSSQGIMPTIWKFHKEDDEEAFVAQGSSCSS